VGLTAFFKNISAYKPVKGSKDANIGWTFVKPVVTKMLALAHSTRAAGHDSGARVFAGAANYLEKRYHAGRSSRKVVGLPWRPALCAIGRYPSGTVILTGSLGRPAGEVQAEQPKSRQVSV
jgi:hypothetical protein